MENVKYKFAGAECSETEIYNLLDSYSLDELQTFMNQGEFDKELFLLLKPYFKGRVLKHVGNRHSLDMD